MWLESEAAQRMRELYPRDGLPVYQTGHLPYIQAVTVTLIARGIDVAALRLPRPQLIREHGVRTAEIELAPAAWQQQFPASHVPFCLHWSDVFGWNYVVDEPTNSGLSFRPGDDTIMRSRGLGPGVSLVADPHHVADAVAGLLSGAKFEPIGWTGRDPDIQDVTLESALAAYRQHPGALALDGKHEDYLVSQDTFLDLDPQLLTDVGQRPESIASVVLDMRAAQLRVTTTRYEVEPLPANAIGTRRANHYKVFVGRVDETASRWVVLAGQRDIPMYLTADGHETSEPHTYDLDTALRTARYVAVQRRQGIFAMTADQVQEARAGTAAAEPRSASMPSTVAAWSQPIRRSLIDHAARQTGTQTALPSSAGRERTGHDRSAER